MEAVDQITGLAKYGPYGVMIALILFCCLTVWVLWKIVTDHSKQMGKHVENSNSVIRENGVIIREHTKASMTLSQSVGLLEKATASLERTFEHFINRTK